LSPEVYRSLLRLTGGDTQVAEDLLADTFVMMARAARSGQIIAVNAAWLHTVARRKFLDRYRRSRSEERAFARIGTRPDEAPEPDWSSIESATGLRACRQLPPMQRAALVLRYLEDLSTAEVATILDKSVTATESLLARARRALAELIAADPTADPHADVRSSQEGHRGS
jgi:RNA polymerase sigma-70 factor, ECF subfamily